MKFSELTAGARFYMVNSAMGAAVPGTPAMRKIEDCELPGGFVANAVREDVELMVRVRPESLVEIRP